MLGRMLSDAVEGARPAAPNVAVPLISTRRAAAGDRVYPDKLDAKLLRVVFVCGMAAVMAVLDSTVVAVA
jgi:DHA2 family multidrug resistance protein